MSNKVKPSKDEIIKSASKILSNKKAVRSYLKGEIAIDTLSKKGIKLAKPL